MLKCLIFQTALLCLFVSFSAGEEPAAVEKFRSAFDIDLAYTQSQSHIAISPFLMDQKSFLEKAIVSAVEAMPDELLLSKSLDNMIIDAYELIEIFLNIGLELNDQEKYNNIIEFLKSYIIASYDFDIEMEKKSLDNTGKVISAIDSLNVAFDRLLSGRGELRITITKVKENSTIDGLIAWPPPQNIGHSLIIDQIGKQFAKTIFELETHSIKTVIQKSMSNVFLKGATVKKFAGIDFEEIDDHENFIMESGESFFDEDERLPISSVSHLAAEVIKNLTSGESKISKDGELEEN